MNTVTLQAEEYRALMADAQRWRTHTADSDGLCPFRDAAIWRRDIGRYLWTNLPDLALMTETPGVRDILREAYLAWSASADAAEFAARVRAERASWAGLISWRALQEIRGETPALTQDTWAEVFPAPRQLSPQEQREASILLDIALGAYDPDDESDASGHHPDAHLEVAA